MKILWIYNQHNPSLEYDHFLHMDFVRYMHHHLDFVKYFDKNSSINKEMDIKAYGANLDHYADISLKYNPKRTLEDIYKEYPFDIIIVNTKGRCYGYYSITPENEVRDKCYLPPDFKEFNLVPKVMIEEDYQYEHNNNWYIEQGFKLLINRHFSNHLKAARLNDIKCKWLPFSVNTELFRPASIENDRICFVGNSDHEIYKDRKEMINLLLASDYFGHKMIDDYGATKRFDEYIRTIQSYTGTLCGVTIYNLTPSKIFEIMACGSILITNNVSKSGIDQLYSPDCYLTFKEDYSDYVNSVKEILSLKKVTSIMREKAIKETQEKHSHNVRIKQLLEILKNL